MNKIVALPFVTLAVIFVGVASCQRIPEESPAAAPAPAPAPERFQVTTLTRDSTNNAKVALIVDSDTGCVFSMVAPEAPKALMGTAGRQIGCNAQNQPPIIAVTRNPVDEARAAIAEQEVATQ